MTPEEIKKINEAREANVNAGLPATSGAGATLGSITEGIRQAQENLNVITSETLGEDETPIQVSEPAPSTISGRIDGKSKAVLTEDELAQKAEQKRTEDEAKYRESQSKTQSFLEQIGIKKKEITAQVEKETDLSGQKLLRTEAIKKLRTAEVAELGEIEALDKMPGTLEQRSQRTVDIRRKYGFEKLEAQLSYHMANADITSAQETLNDRLTLELEPLYQQLELQKGVSEQIYDSLTTSEKREWDLAVSRTENAIQERKDIATYRSGIITTAMKNGVPLPSYVVQELNKAGSVEEVNQILARNQVSLQDPLERKIKQAQLAKLGVELDQARLESIASEIGATSPYQAERQVRTLQSVEELRKRVNFQTVGIVSLGKFLPGSVPRNFKTDLDTLKATIAFGELTAMREASKTGGALGQISNIELGLLESALGGLDQGQSPANFRKNLDKIEASIKRWQGAANAVSEEDQLRALGYTEEQIQQIKSAQ